MPRTENESTPKVISGYLYTDEGGCAVGSSDWFAWLNEHSAFYYESPVGLYSARRELRKGYWYWYAYRRAHGPHSKLHNCYLGKSEQLTAARLADVAQRLAEQIERP